MLRKLLTLTAAALLGLLTLCPSLGHAAQYELGTPFPATCEGILNSRNGIYFLTKTLITRDQVLKTISSAATPPSLNKRLNGRTNIRLKKTQSSNFCGSVH
jgi:hypothetical protein